MLLICSEISLYLNLSVIPHIIDQIFVANKFMTVLRHYDLDNRKYAKIITLFIIENM